MTRLSRLARYLGFTRPTDAPPPPPGVYRALAAVSVPAAVLSLLFGYWLLALLFALGVVLMLWLARWSERRRSA